jgi:general secretion pathway protein D
VSDVVPTTTSSINSPTIRQRRINSSVAVHSGTEIVLGGLIGSSRSKGESGIPLLMDIPLVGNAFKSQAARGADRSELLVILRPTVMGNRLDIESVTREIKSRMSGATGAIYR